MLEYQKYLTRIIINSFKRTMQVIQDCARDATKQNAKCTAIPVRQNHIKYK